MSDRVVFLRPLGGKQCFGRAVATLLSPIRLHTRTRVMPDDSPWRKPDPPPALLNPPADVDIIARNPKTRIESSDRAERGRFECHVAAGHMLGLLISAQHIDRSAGRVGDALRNQSIARWRDVRSAHRRELT